MDDESPEPPPEDGTISGSKFALRAIGIIAAIVIVAVAFKNCGQHADTAQTDPAEKDQRGDYLSTVFRARERATKTLNEVNDIRKTQKREELEFDKKPGAKP
jgi:hypothetical protein